MGRRLLLAKILLIQIQYAPYPGVAYLNGAALSHGHQFVLCLGNKPKKILARIAAEKPDLIGFTCMSGLHLEILKIAQEIKKHFSQPIILGGPHPTLFSEIINEECVDIICRGEGEFPLIELLDALQEKRSYAHILNLWVKTDGHIEKNPLRPLADPLDNIPLIDWSCYRGTVIQNGLPEAFIIRGCPYSCTYCFNASMREMHRGLGRYVRHFSVERAIQEVQQALKFFSHSAVYFHSDSFGMDLPWIEAFFKRYSQVTDLPFFLLIRTELASEPFIRIVSQHKCHSIAIGLEAGSERVRREILHRNYSNQALLEIAERMHRYGIKFRTFNMIGIPTETEDEMWQTIDINIRMKTDYPRGAIFTPLPSTEIVDMAKSMGYLEPNFSFDSIPPSILSASILKKVDRNRIKNTLYFFQSAILFPRAKGLFRKLTHWEPNLLFRLWFYLIYAYVHMRHENRKPLPYLKYLIANWKMLWV
jgi:anaerobic magnesium-protoporphyrin IX monomethyl ester cyclase